MHAHQTLITNFYTAFQQRDHASMAAAYTPEARFSDPVFPDLRGARIGGMWRFLCERGSDLQITFSSIHADELAGRAHWEATYSFGRRRVHNIIEASFTFEDGRIATHTDQFDLTRWMHMALGPAGLALGWLPPVQGLLRRQVGNQLDRFCERRGIG